MTRYWLILRRLQKEIMSLSMSERSFRLTELSVIGEAMVNQASLTGESVSGQTYGRKLSYMPEPS